VRPGGGKAPALEVQTALWVSGVAVIVLVIACANLINLMLSRAIARHQETATLAALGAGRARLVTRALAESLLLALLGAAGAVVVAQWSLTSIFGMLIPNARDLLPVTSVRTLTLTAAVALITGLVLGLLPMLFAWRPMSQADLRSAARGSTARASAVRGTLVVVQAALSLMLLVGAVLFTNSLEAVKSARYGYEPDRVLLVNTTFRGAPLSPAERAAVRQRLLDAAAALPDVEAASWKTSTPLGLNASLRFFVDDVASLGQLGQFTAQEATGGYFAAMGTRILRGRPITADDRATAPRVVVVSEGMANVLWPGKDPIGQCLRFGSETAPCTSVVGVAEDIVQTTISSNERYQYYLPLDQGPGGGTGLVLRMRGAPAQQADTVRRALQPLMPGMSYVTTQPLAELVTRAQRSWRLGATMFLALSGLALMVAAVGLYGVIRYNVAQRTREMGIRAALGARGSDLVGLVVGPNLRLTLIGIVLGGVLGWAASARLQPLLFEQSATDVRAYALAAAVLAVTALAASLAPALRATRVPPSVALRAE
jgi:putative ABC transport system permease protein